MVFKNELSNFARQREVRTGTQLLVPPFVKLSDQESAQWRRDSKIDAGYSNSRFSFVKRLIVTVARPDGSFVIFRESFS